MLCCVGKKGSHVLVSMMTTTSWEVGGFCMQGREGSRHIPPARGMKCQEDCGAADVSGTDNFESHEYQCGVRATSRFFLLEDPQRLLGLGRTSDFSG